MKNKTKKMKNKTKLNMVIRENTLDQFVINESDYERCDFQKEDIWLDAGDWNKAADEMVDSRWFEQVPNRAKRLVDRMRSLNGSI